MRYVPLYFIPTSSLAHIAHQLLEVFYGPRSLVFPEADNRKWTIMAMFECVYHLLLFIPKVHYTLQLAFWKVGSYWRTEPQETPGLLEYRMHSKSAEGSQLR